MGAKNDLVRRELKIDVPTIGNVYKQAVKEIRAPQDSYSMQEVTGALRDAIQKNCIAIAGSLVLPVLQEMDRRSSVNPLDKISGLAEEKPEVAWMNLLRKGTGEGEAKIQVKYLDLLPIHYNIVLLPTAYSALPFEACATITFQSEKSLQ
ncbi:hypothetical protein BDZ91DRAFT_763276 [Kalaharituber pfeilii]|nr:hypothetical protein BDZ91DRAFT_763276 [Kalaharituber pfeilii]